MDVWCIIPYMNEVQLDASIECVSRTGPDERTLVSVLEAAEQLENRLEEALGAVGLSLSKFDALDQLMQCDHPLTLGDLAGRLCCVRSNVTQLVDRLEAEGLARRAPDPADARAALVSLTPAGRRRAKRVLAARGRVLGECLGGLSAAESAQLAALVAKILDTTTDGRLAARATCRLCDAHACGHDDGRCPVTLAANAAEAAR